MLKIVLGFVKDNHRFIVCHLKNASLIRSPDNFLSKLRNFSDKHEQHIVRCFVHVLSILWETFQTVILKTCFVCCHVQPFAPAKTLLVITRNFPLIDPPAFHEQSAACLPQLFVNIVTEDANPASWRETTTIRGFLE